MAEIDASELVELEKESVALATDPKFAEVLRVQKDLNDRITAARKRIEGAMILSKTKKISGEWGYITLKETTLFTVDTDELPAKFFKKVPDTKKIGDTYKLTGKAVKGTTPRVSTSLQIGIK